MAIFPGRILETSHSAPPHTCPRSGRLAASPFDQKGPITAWRLSGSWAGKAADPQATHGNHYGALIKDTVEKVLIAARFIF